MSLIPRSSFFDLDTMFDRPWLGLTPPTSRETAFSPRVDVREKDKEYEITAELPGVKKEDVNVTLKNGVLSIQAESQQEDKEEKDGRIVRQERRYGHFVRSFDLGNDVQDSDISASFKDGVLHLRVPKSPVEAPTAKRIEIK